MILKLIFNFFQQHGVENSADVINELVQKITEAQQRAKKGIKAQKVKKIKTNLKLLLIFKTFFS